MKKIQLKEIRPTSDDVLIFFDFLQLTAVIIQLSNRFYIETNIKRKADRRAFLVKGDMSHYKTSVQTYQRRKQDL